MWDKDTLAEKLREACQAQSFRAQQARDTLERLGRTCDAESLFTAAAVQLSAAGPDATESSMGPWPVKVELLAYHLFPFLGCAALTPTFWQLRSCFLAVDDLISARTFLTLSTATDPNSPDDRLDQIVKQFLLHYRTVRGSAYPLQTETQIAGIQNRFETWFQGKFGLSPSRAAMLCLQIVRCLEEKANVFRLKQLEVGAKWRDAWQQMEHHETVPPSDEMVPSPENLPDAETARGVGVQMALLADLSGVRSGCCKVERPDFGACFSVAEGRRRVAGADRGGLGRRR